MDSSILRMGHCKLMLKNCQIFVLFPPPTFQRQFEVTKAGTIHLGIAFNLADTA